jgi:hypothetical protein
LEGEVEKKTNELSAVRDVNMGAQSGKGYWEVANRMYWQRDVTFKDDPNTTMEKHRNLQTMK